MTLTTLTRDQLLAKSGVVLVVDQIQPPSGPVAKGGVPVLKPRELGLFIAVNDDGQVYGFNGHVDLGTGIRTSLAQIVADFHTTYPGWMPGAELHSRLEQADFLADVARETAPGG